MHGQQNIQVIWYVSEETWILSPVAASHSFSAVECNTVGAFNNTPHDTSYNSTVPAVHTVLNAQISWEKPADMIHVPI